MKNCPNCSKGWPEDYAGTCDGCGASLGSGYKSSNLSSASSEEKDAQLRMGAAHAQRDQGIANAMSQSRGVAPSGMQVPPSTVEVARNFSGGIANELQEAFGDDSSSV
jgi:hypothetical protein